MIRKLLVLSVLGLVLAAIAAPVALAKPVSSDITNGGYDAWAVGQIYKSTHPGTQNLGPLDPWAYAAIHKNDATTPVVTTSASSGFDFSDAGIGAAVAFGAAVILLGGAIIVTKLRRDNLAIS